MINVIICDNEKEVTDRVREIITKIMFKTRFDYKIHVYNKYDKEFEKIMNEELENKIYILDIEVEDKSGIQMAKKIRKTDWESVIILLTAHYELEELAYKSKILLLDFISKYEIYDEKINETISMCLERKITSEKLAIKERGRIKRLSYNDILYISCETDKRKLKIKTITKEHESNESLLEIKDRLRGKFIQTHRACIVNMGNVSNIDTKNKVIKFTNGKETNLLSRRYMKEVVKYANN